MSLIGHLGCRRAAVAVALWAALAGAGTGSAQEIATFPAKGDAVFSFARSGGDLLAGYASGRLVRRDASGSKVLRKYDPRAGGILAILPVAPASAGAAAGFVAATATGQVLRFNDPSAGPVWRFTSTCEVSSLAETPDLNGDGVAEVVAGGADHRVHLFDGARGRAIWSHLFKSDAGNEYVIRVLVADDVDADVPRNRRLLWSGDLCC